MWFFVVEVTWINGGYPSDRNQGSSLGFSPRFHLANIKIETRKMVPNGGFEWADEFHYELYREWIPTGKILFYFPSILGGKIALKLHYTNYKN